MTQRELTEQDVQDVWTYEFDPDLDQKPAPYTAQERQSHARGRALRPMVVLHKSHRAIIGHAADDANRESVEAKSESPVLARLAGYLSTSQTRRWIGLSWK